MTQEHQPKDFHARAAKSSIEARGRAMNLSAAGIAGLFALFTSDGFTADTLDKILIITSGCALASAIGFGVFNSYSDAQWSYYRAQLASGKSETEFRKFERRWHWHKRISELGTQFAFVLGVIAAAALLVRLVAALPGN